MGRSAGIDVTTVGVCTPYSGARSSRVIGFLRVPAGASVVLITIGFQIVGVNASASLGMRCSGE